MPDTPQKNPNGLTRALNAALAGVLAGTVLALADFAQAVYSLGSVLEGALLALQAIARIALAGAVLGAVVSVVGQAGGRLNGFRGRPFRLGAEALTTLIAAPGLIYIAVRLFQGGATSRLPWRPALVAAAALILAGLFFAAARIARVLVARADAGRLRGLSLAILVALLAVAAFALRWCDAHLYKRLYLYLHGALGLAALGGLALGFRAGLLRIGTRTGLRLPVLSLLLVAALYAGAVLTFGKRQSVQRAAWEQTTTLADCLRLTAIAGGGEPRALPLDEETRRLFRERARRARAAAASDWPVFPNAHVLLVTVDALRAERVGILSGNRLGLTPNLDRWASEKAVLFERAYVSAPHSSYSITAMHTSRFIHDEAMLGRELKYPTMASALRSHGYDAIGLFTQGIFFTEGENVKHYQDSDFDFEEVTHGAFTAAETTDRAIAAIDRLRADPEALGFIWVHYFNVHEPYRASQLGTSPIDRYSSEIQLTDREAARLIAYAEQAFGANLITIFTADHGEEFKEHGGYYHGSTLYDEQVWVPLFIRVPGNRPNRVRAPVSTVGLAPTALRLVGITPPPSMIGEDLRPALFGGDLKHVPSPVFASVVRQHMVVEWPYKLIADPSRRLYELYDLASDPQESHNLYDRKSKKADALLKEIQVWCDQIASSQDTVETALNRGRMRDVRAVQDLIQVAGDEKAKAEKRLEAIDLLGQIRDYSAVPMLNALLDDPSPRIAVTAAFALGDLEETGGRDLMRTALFDPDPSIRDRAAMALGRLGDPTATAALVDALGRDDNKIREKAIRMLGYLADPIATEPLIASLDDQRNRYLIVLALGKIGDPQAFKPLMALLDEDYKTDVRGYVVVALGWLEMPEAIPRLLRVLAEEPEIKWTAEALVRLGAVGAPPLFGTDAAKGLPALKGGFGSCTEKPRILNEEFLGRTFCRTTGPSAALKFFTDIPGEATVIIRARHLSGALAGQVGLGIEVDGRKLEEEIPLLEEFQEYRIKTKPGLWKAGEHRVLLRLRRPGAFELDHVLVFSG